MYYSHVGYANEYWCSTVVPFSTPLHTPTHSSALSHTHPHPNIQIRIQKYNIQCTCYSTLNNEKLYIYLTHSVWCHLGLFFWNRKEDAPQITLKYEWK